jgi:hypothetical protein
MYRGSADLEMNLEVTSSVSLNGFIVKLGIDKFGTL